MPLGLTDQGWVVSRKEKSKPIKVDEHTGNPPISPEMHIQEGEALNTHDKL